MSAVAALLNYRWAGMSSEFRYRSFFFSSLGEFLLSLMEVIALEEVIMASLVNSFISPLELVLRVLTI